MVLRKLNSYIYKNKIGTFHSIITHRDELNINHKTYLTWQNILLKTERTFFSSAQVNDTETDPYDGPVNKPQQVYKNSKPTKCVLRSHWNQTRK